MYVRWIVYVPLPPNNFDVPIMGTILVTRPQEYIKIRIYVFICMNLAQSILCIFFITPKESTGITQILQIFSPISNSPIWVTTQFQYIGLLQQCREKKNML